MSDYYSDLLAEASDCFLLAADADLSASTCLDDSALDQFVECRRAGAEASDDEALSSCSGCGNRVQKMNLNLICSYCGMIQERVLDPEDPLPSTKNDTISVPHFRIVGSNAYLYQSNLYKSSTSNYKAIQRLNNERTFNNCINSYVEKGKRLPVSISVCKRASDLYHQVQEHGIRRSENRMITIAACLYYAAVDMNTVPQERDIADFLQLSKKGFSTGKQYLLKLHNEGKISINPSQSVSQPMIKTLLACLEIESDEEQERLTMAITDLIETMKVNNICNSLQIKTKIVGATFCILQRSKPISINEFCEKCKRRKNTVSSITSKINMYHHYFKHIYEEYGLLSDHFE